MCLLLCLVDRGYLDSGGDLSQCKQVYREVYCNGCQVGHYGEPDRIGTTEFSERAGVDR